MEIVQDELKLLHGLFVRNKISILFQKVFLYSELSDKCILHYIPSCSSILVHLQLILMFYVKMTEELPFYSKSSTFFKFISISTPLKTAFSGIAADKFLYFLRRGIRSFLIYSEFN